tara:strand:- start:191620 stop:192906 length:1287 start_codon:yes stop_codon:yes gene_type:complete
MGHNRRISVVGLGYVGLPVACAFGALHDVIGFDVNKERINALQNGQDHTEAVTAVELAESNIDFTCEKSKLQTADCHIIAVPTPVDEAHQPDLTCLIKASETIGSILKKGDIVVYESTVYPGVTEEICLPILEKISKLKGGKDFTVGYSPERINPGDKERSFQSIVKVVSGQDEKTTEILEAVYGEVVKAGIFKAQSIKVAEAAKVIENTQRDLNIALMNELAIIFEKMGIDTHSVIEAAKTKWNFLPFYPGLVGGHCIGVDPYYLTFKAKQLGYRPEVIQAGRRINDSMGRHVAQQTIKHMIQADSHVKGARVAILGLTFKENCPDVRNTRVVDVIAELQSFGAEVVVHDPIASKVEAKAEYDVDLVEWQAISDVDAIVLCVPHKEFLEKQPQEFANCFANSRIIFDVKSVLNQAEFKAQEIQVWRL